MKCHSCDDSIPGCRTVYMKKDCSFCSDECRSECRSECNNEQFDFRKENVCCILFLKLKEFYNLKCLKNGSRRTMKKTSSEIGL